MSETGTGGGSVLREIAAAFGIAVEEDGVHELHDGLEGLIHRIHEFGEVLLEGAFVEGMREFVNESAEAAEQLHLSATMLGLSTESLQTWRYAASLNGVTQEALNGSLAIFQRNSQGAITGNHEMAATFRRLGVDVRDSHGQVRGLDELLPQVAEGFANIENPTERTATAFALFGRSGAHLVPLLARGAEGIAEMRAQVEELGGGASEQMIENSVELIHTQHRLDLAWFSLRSRIANGLLPMFTRFTEIGVEAVAGFNRLTGGTHILGIALTALQGILAVLAVRMLMAFAAPLAIFALAAVAITAVVLAIDDLITTFEGGDSVIRRFVDELFGVGTTANTVARGIRNITDSWHTLTSLFTREGRAAASQDLSDLIEGEHGAVAPQRTPEAATRAMIESAALRGEVIGRHGQSYEDALAEANRIREAHGLTGIGGEIVGRGAVLSPAFAGPRMADVPAAPRGATSVEIHSPVTITVPQGTDASQISAIRQIVVGTLDERNRQAAAIMSREAP